MVAQLYGAKENYQKYALYEAEYVKGNSLDKSAATESLIS